MHAYSLAGTKRQMGLQKFKKGMHATAALYHRFLKGPLHFTPIIYIYIYISVASYIAIAIILAPCMHAVLIHVTKTIMVMQKWPTAI